MAKQHSAGYQQPRSAKGWLWAVRISLLAGALTCVPQLVDSLLFVFALAADLVLIGFLFTRPGRRALIFCVVVGGLAFFFLGLPQAFIPELGYSWELSLAFLIAHLSIALTATEAQELLDYGGEFVVANVGDPRWVSAVRVLTLISTVPAWAIVIMAYAASRRGPCAEKPELQFLALLPAVLPYLDILWHMRARARARGLGLAVAVGAVWVVGIAMSSLVLREQLSTMFPWLIAFGVLQFGLCLASLKAYATLNPAQRGAWQIPRGLGLAIVYAFLGLTLVLLASPPFRHPRQGGNQAAAVGSLRVLVTAQITYASLHDGNYSPSLAALVGPSKTPSAVPGASEEPLIDEPLATGTKLGYRFTYTPGPPDANGHVSSFTVTARPASNGESGCASYFTDQTGVIRSTREDRPPTVADSPLSG